MHGRHAQGRPGRRRGRAGGAAGRFAAAGDRLSQSGLGEGRAPLADLEAGSRPQEIVAAEAAAAGAAAEESRLLTEYRRKTPLFQRGTITSEEYDAARAAYQVALERHRQAVAQLKLAQEGYRKQRIEEARAAAAQAKAHMIWSRRARGRRTSTRARPAASRPRRHSLWPKPNSATQRWSRR